MSRKPSGTAVAGAGEKLKPHHDLAAFKKSFAANLRMTKAALLGAAALGMSQDDVGPVIATLDAKHFYKSMASHFDRRRWQDVYHLPYDGLTIYVKFTDDVVTAFTLLSFKEK
ncbi:MAG: type II toxin-antitoxin system MqsR family toxin [Alphaproteobacteria bacterium]|nr:type II toxin-antitoxin system MqsR family toxin [Alphaproteobacteria bacterium]